MSCLIRIYSDVLEQFDNYSNSNSEELLLEFNNLMQAVYVRWQIQRQGFFASYNFFMKYIALISSHEKDHKSIAFGVSYPSLYPSEYHAFTEHALIPKFRSAYYRDISVADPGNVPVFPRSCATGHIEKEILKECKNVIATLLTKNFLYSDLPEGVARLSLQDQLRIVENLYFEDANFKKIKRKLQSINAQEQQAILQQNPEDVLALMKLDEYHYLHLKLESAVVRYRFIRAFLEVNAYGYCLSSPYPQNLFSVELDFWQSIPESESLFDFFSNHVFIVDDILHVFTTASTPVPASSVSSLSSVSAATSATTSTGTASSSNSRTTNNILSNFIVSR